ncbi:hypothetical protein LNAOJCKE_5326 [Methylorubrum aminovorans]|uniref:Uncharacterized protein n=1 Tax=Methylorubrum aminovorans TaxID=269069 RepID=A0ABQ4UQQ2_9HYPH|nr:hypothetical protein LNAOJCKE_5326 [Methylorubrum aminovorans]
MEGPLEGREYVRGRDAGGQMRRACAEVLTVHHCVQSQGLMA